MESDHPRSSVNRPSGIQRASRLPVLRPRSSQVLVPNKQEEVVETPKQADAASTVQKTQSTASLRRPAQNGYHRPAAISKPATSRTKAFNDANQSASSHASGRGQDSHEDLRKPGRPMVKPILTPETEEVHDQLSSLDSYRPASRAGSRDGSPPGLPEYAQPSTSPRKEGRARASRPSLSERTMESIQNLPSTPKARRRSSFFSPIQSPMPPPPRPSSSLSRNGTNGNSRPGTSDGTSVKLSKRALSPAKQVPASAKPASRTSFGGFGFTPSRSVSSTFKTSQQRNKDAIPPSPSSASPAKQAAPTTLPTGLRSMKQPSLSKTVAAGTTKPRPALDDAFGSAVRAGAIADSRAEAQMSQSPSGSPNTAKRAASNPSNASSSALRQQIAAAKAAARKDKVKHDSYQEVPLMNGHDFDTEMQASSFNHGPHDQKHILRNRINAARMDGKLNIAAMGLKDIPLAVMKMYDADAMEESNVSWAEVVDPSRLNAADNEIEELGDQVFPDVSAEDLALDEQTTGNQFGGLETLDLHGNKLHSLPRGLRRLERLTTLDLAHNRLENDALEVISQISSLRILKLGHNALSGAFPATVCSLQHLETLDLQSNRFLALPEALRELISLRVLNVSGNQLTMLPMEALQESNLIELDASKNALIGSLFPEGGRSGHATLQTLKVSNNSLAALAFSESLEMPCLRTLDVMNNHLRGIPAVSQWTELITLIAADNKIKELPVGFATLQSLRNVNFASNELRIMDPEIARMDALESLILTSNPLRERRLITMNTADIKRELMSRLEPLPTESEKDTEAEELSEARDSLSPQPRPSTSISWKLTSNSALELAAKGLTDAMNDSLGSFLRGNEVRQLQLSTNKLTVLPPALWLGQHLKVLDLSGNALSSGYLSDELELLSLQELNISKCSLSTLEPLETLLQAPNLRALDITLNRLTGALPTIRTTYPALTTLLAGDNNFTSVTAESLRGLHAVNLASNSIGHLPAEIGLLWDEGLRSLEIGSNAFRVPNFRILEKGTEATLRYLRGRIPAGQSTNQ